MAHLVGALTLIAAPTARCLRIGLRITDIVAERLG